MNFEDIYYMDDASIIKIIKNCQEEDLFLALIIQANVVQDKLQIFLPPDIYKRVKDYKVRPLAINPVEIHAATSRIEEVMKQILTT